jgi:hypothetical protein
MASCSNIDTPFSALFPVLNTPVSVSVVGIKEFGRREREVWFTVS